MAKKNPLAAAAAIAEQAKPKTLADEVLYGSDKHPALIDIEGEQVQLGKVVDRAFLISKMSVDDWNSQEVHHREALIDMTIELLKQEAINARIESDQKTPSVDDLPGMRERSDFEGGATDTAVTPGVITTGMATTGELNGTVLCTGDGSGAPLPELEPGSGYNHIRPIHTERNVPAVLVAIEARVDVEKAITALKSIESPTDNQVIALRHLKLAINALQGD